MTGRLLPLLCCFLLLLCAQGIGLHVHWHQHGQQALHSHVASILDADHGAAHVQGDSEDREKQPGAARLSVPDLLIALVVVLSPFTNVPAVERPPLVDWSLATGPPQYRRPPGQAPPELFLIL